MTLRELDTMIHELVFKIPVVGLAPVVEGEWEPEVVLNTIDEEYWKPVFVSDCCCSYTTKVPSIHGHQPECFAVVPEYSSQLTAAFAVLKELGKEWALGKHEEQYVCCVCEQLDSPRPNKDLVGYDSVEEAICWAALNFITDDPNGMP